MARLPFCVLLVSISLPRTRLLHLLRDLRWCPPWMCSLSRRWRAVTWPQCPWQVCPPQEQTGSGFIIAGRKILTNAHVVTHSYVDVRVRRYGCATKHAASSFAASAAAVTWLRAVKAAA